MDNGENAPKNDVKTKGNAVRFSNFGFQYFSRKNDENREKSNFTTENHWKSQCFEAFSKIQI